MNSMDSSVRDQDTSVSQNILSSNQLGANVLEGRKPKNHIPVLDGVRAIACLGVLSYHLDGRTGLWRHLDHIHDVPGMLTYFAAALGYAGDSGVILFFLLSGFLLFLPYAKALLFESPWPSLRRFYLRRIFRILPGYYVALFLLLVINHPKFLDASHWYNLWLFLTFRMDHALSGQVDGSFWTLAIEFQFYLLLPIIAWLFSLIVRDGTLRWHMLKLTLCLLLLAAWGLLIRYWGLSIANTSKLNFLIPHRVSAILKPYLYSDTGKYFEVFAVGMLLSMIYTYTQYAPSAEAWRIRIRYFSSLLFTVGLALLFLLSLWYFYFKHVGVDVYNYSKHYANHIKQISVFTFLDPRIPIIMYRYWLEWEALAYATGYGLCLLALLYGSPRLKRPFEAFVLRWVALISFSFYIWHEPLLDVFTRFILVNIRRQNWSPLVQYSAFWWWALIVIFPASAMLYHCIEKPGICFGKWLIRKLER